jgi:hypothetical protein
VPSTPVEASCILNYKLFIHWNKNIDQ